MCNEILMKYRQNAIFIEEKWFEEYKYLWILLTPKNEMSRKIDEKNDISLEEILEKH